MQDQDIINEEERHESATEEPTTPGCPQHMPTHLPSGFDGVEPGQDTKNKTVMKSIKWPEGFSFEVAKNGRKLVGVIQECGAYLEDETYPYRFFATVYEGTDIVFSITSCARGLYFQKKILKSAMHEAVTILSHCRRLRANKKAKNGGLA